MKKLLVLCGKKNMFIYKTQIINKLWTIEDEMIQFDMQQCYFQK